MENKNTDSKGFIVLSKQAFHVHFEDRLCKVISFDEAWLRLLEKVNHSEGKVRLQGDIIRCKPGESMMTQSSWARHFGWSRFRTRRFFERLVKTGYVQTQTYKGRFCIRICAYDQWVKGKNKSVKEDHSLPLFNYFWEMYHKITGMTKLDRIACHEIWKQLSEEEMKKATQQITPYMETRLLTLPKYNKSAKMYLKEKVFIL